MPSTVGLALMAAILPCVSCTLSSNIEFGFANLDYLVQKIAVSLLEPLVLLVQGFSLIWFSVNFMMVNIHGFP